MGAREKILVRSVNWLGDAVMSTSAILRIREARPNASITILAPEKLGDLWRDQPYIDDCMVFTSKENPLQIGRRLQWGQFDVAVIFPNSPRSAMESWFGCIPERIGYRRPWRNFFLTRKIDPFAEERRMRKRSDAEIRERIAQSLSRESYPSAAHHVRSYLNLVAAAFGTSTEIRAPELCVSPKSSRSFKERFAITDSTLPFVGLNAGAEYGAAKRWPVERFIETARLVQARRPCRWLIFGGPADKTLGEQIKTALDRSFGGTIINLAGSTSLRELCAGLSLCAAVVTNDTGPMHVAAALGVPVVVPFGSTSPELTGPLGEASGVICGEAPCAPCFRRECPIDLRCLASITSKQVAENVLSQLSQS